MSQLRRNLKRALARGRRGVPGARSRPATRHALVGPPQLWAVKRRFQSEFLIARGLRPEQRLLDIGCGTLRGGIPLIEYLDAGHYFGVEARKQVLDEAYKELAETGLEGKSPTLIHAADPAQVSLEKRVQVAWAFSVLIHMEDEVVDACLGLVARVLAEGGVFYANVILGDGPRAQWREFPVVPRSREFYESLATRHALEFAVLGTLKNLGYPQESEGGNGTMLRLARASDR